MSDSMKRNLKVMGETQSNGGSFDKVRIMGECSVSGSIDAQSCKVMGECTVSGDLSSGYLRNMGEVTVGGRLAAEESRLMGETQVNGSCALKQSSIYGELTVAKDLSGEELKVHGMLNVAGNASLETLIMRGGIKVGGLLNCDQIDIILKINAENDVKEIGAGSVSIKKRRSFFSRAPITPFRADSIEGDHVSLEFTEAKVVRGVNVEIADGCTIERVEYSGSYKTSGKIKVGEVVHLDVNKK